MRGGCHVAAGEGAKVHVGIGWYNIPVHLERNRPGALRAPHVHHYMYSCHLRKKCVAQ